MIARIPVEVPAAGTTTHIEIQGVEIVVEKTPDNTPTGVPLVRTDSPDGDAYPAFNQTSFRPEGGFHRLYVEGTVPAAGGTLYLAVLTSHNAQLRIASTVE